MTSHAIHSGVTTACPTPTTRSPSTDSIPLPAHLEERRESDATLIGQYTGDKSEKDSNGSSEKGTSTTANSVVECEPDHGRLLPLGRFVMVYACLGLSIFLTSIDQTIVACILPNISSQFGAQDAPWVGIAFLLMQTVFSPCYGRMSDVFGRKPLLLTAIAIFLVGTAICGAAPSIRVLIVARAIAGVGGAGLLSMVHICISDIVTLRKRGIYHGILSAINGTGSVLGPITGGAFASNARLGWRWAFYVQVPIIAVAGIVTILVLPSNLGKHDRRALREKARTIDYVGSALFVGGTTLLLLGLLFIAPPSVPVVTAKVLAPLFSGIALLAVFVYWEWKHAVQPIIPFHIFRIVAVDQVYIVNFVFGYVFYAVLYYVPQFYQVVSNQDAVQSSISLMPVVVTSIVLSWLTGLLTTLMGRYKWSLVIGSGLQLLGSVLLYTLFRPAVPQATAVGVMVITGIGFGSQMQSSIVGCQSATRQSLVAVATSMRNFSRNIGGVLGIAVSGIIIHVRFPQYVSQLQPPPDVMARFYDIQNDPLQLHVIDEAQLGGIGRAKAISLYADVLRDTYLAYVPLSAVAFVTCVLLHEYRLQRTADGEPIRAKPLHTVCWEKVRSIVSKDGGASSPA